MNDNENSKNPAWQVPVDLPQVEPEEYDVLPHDNDNIHTVKEDQKKQGQFPLHDEEIGGG